MRVVVVVRSSTRAKTFSLDVADGAGRVLCDGAVGAVDGWLGVACVRTAGDSLCRSITVEVHADGAECDHEVPHV